MNLCKNKFLNILLNILLIVILPFGAGVLIFFYLEYFLLLIFIVPGFIAFLADALKNGSNNM